MGDFLQVCEERLQFSLSENVKTNVLWGSAVKDTVMLRTWGEQAEESDELMSVRDQEEDERYESSERKESASHKSHKACGCSPHTRETLEAFKGGPVMAHLSSLTLVEHLYLISNELVDNGRGLQP